VKFDMNKLRQQFDHALRGFTRGQKAMMGLAVVAVLAGLFVFTRSQGGPSMATLYTDLEASDASTITTELESQGMTYELADSGRTIKVPADKVATTRIALAGADIKPSGGDAWNIMDKQGLTASTLQQKVALQRALSGDLVNTIEDMDGVAKANVTLVMPEDDVFAKDALSASASVLVKTEGQAQLGKEQVKSIANFVATGVPGLTTDRITITDQNGRNLWFPGQGGANAASGDESFAQKLKFEENLSNKVQSLLEVTAGPGKARVAVNADLDLSQQESTEKIVASPNPVGQPALLESSSGETEQMNGPGNNVVGVIGTDGQPLVPGGAIGGTTGEGQSYTRAQSANDFALNEVLKARVEAPGKVIRQSVSVLLDQGAVSQAQAEQIRNTIVEAAGLDLARGDTLSVERVPFDTSAAEAAEAALLEDSTARNDQTAALLRGLGVAILVLGALFIAWRSLRRKSQPTYIEIDPYELERVREMEAMDVQLALEAQQHELMGLPAGDDLVELTDAEAAAFNDIVAAEHDEDDPWASEYPVPATAAMVDEWQSELVGMVDDQSEEVAQLLRHWLGDRRVGAQ
jgi:flagellar M-ring protein FliF